MSEESIHRLRQKQLTDVDQYRHMQRVLADGNANDQQEVNTKEEWKKWQLAPISAGENSSDPDLIDQRSEKARDLYHAIRVLDAK